MYPEHPTPPPNPQQPQPPLDYLNQIAPQTTKKSMLTPGPKLFALIGAALVVVIIIVSITLNVVVNSKRAPLERLSARMSATATIVEDSQSTLKSSELRSLNSNLKIYFTNVNRDIVAPLSSSGVNTESLSASIVAEESTAATAERLENARLNAVFDRTYAREMAYQLAQLLALLQQIQTGGYNTETTTFAQEAYDNLLPSQEAFSDYNAANS